MKATIAILSLFICSAWCSAGQNDIVDPNPGFQKLIAGATKVVVRNGGDICCVSPKETLNQEVYFIIEDSDVLRELAKNIVFLPATEKNSCFCCGHPGIDWYVGDQRVALTGWKHGFGLMAGGVVAFFTPESKTWMRKWLLEHGLTENQIR